jgi:hypothetical protein
MLRSRAVLLSVLLTATAAACARENSSLVALTQALRQAYPGVRVEVRLANAGHRLGIQVDSAAWRNYRLATSELRARGLPIARFALQHYGAGADLDSVTIDFIQERTGAFVWKRWAFIRTTFGVGEVR